MKMEMLTFEFPKENFPAVFLVTCLLKFPFMNKAKEKLGYIYI